MNRICSNHAKCVVCSSDIAANRTYCNQCSVLKSRQSKYSNTSKRAALQKSWNDGRFVCYYSGAELELNRSESPRYLTYDDKTPRCTKANDYENRESKL